MAGDNRTKEDIAYERKHGFRCCDCCEGGGDVNDPLWRKRAAPGWRDGFMWECPSCVRDDE